MMNVLAGHGGSWVGRIETICFVLDCVIADLELMLLKLRGESPWTFEFGCPRVRKRNEVI
jgi:hypothetical protein